MPDGGPQKPGGGWTGKAKKTTTGRFLVLLGTKDPKEARNTLSKLVGITTLAAASDFSHGAVDTREFRKSSSVGLFLDNLGVAAVSVEPEQQKKLSSASLRTGVPIIAVEPERYVYAAGPRATQGPWDESRVTWGLQAVEVPKTRFGGRGATVAVLDSGIDSSHPDMGSRVSQSESFIPNDSVDDRNGHGTHCAGTACGPREPRHQTRYGIAYNARGPRTATF